MTNIEYTTRQLAGNTILRLQVRGEASLELETYKRREAKLNADAKAAGIEFKVVAVEYIERYKRDYVRMELVKADKLD